MEGGETLNSAHQQATPTATTPPPCLALLCDQLESVAGMHIAGNWLVLAAVKF